MEWLNQIQNNQWAWMALAICTVLSVVLAVYFGIKSMEKKKIKFLISSDILISRQRGVTSKLKILYDDKEIDDLCVTKIAFWNNSNITINDSDIVNAEPLRIVCKYIDILDTSVVYGKTESNKIRIENIEKDSINVLFDYLDKKDGGIIKIIHTNGKRDITFSGKIKGGCIEERLTKIEILKKLWDKFVKNFANVGSSICGILILFYLLTYILGINGRPLSDFPQLLAVPIGIGLLIFGYFFKIIFSDFTCRIPKQIKKVMRDSFLEER